ncbi:hypothetical protein [Rhodococcus koreensis]
MRLLEQWLTHSSLLRSLVASGDRDRLWLGLSYVGKPFLIREIDRVGIQRWVNRHGLLGADGRPLKIHRARIRTTHHTMREKKTWTGNARATIDPNHTPAVEGDHYLSVTTAGQRHAVETVIEDAQHDLLRRAHPPTVIAEEDAAALADGYPQLVAAMNLDDHAIADLVGGARDVFTAACGDQLAGLHGPVGKPCPARPWVCLLYPLAVFAPRHAVNLLRLKAFFSRQWQQLPAAQFMAVFGPYATRIDQIPAGSTPPNSRPRLHGSPTPATKSPSPRGTHRMTTFATDSAHEHRPSAFTGTDVCLQGSAPSPPRSPRWPERGLYFVQDGSFPCGPDISPVAKRVANQKLISLSGFGVRCSLESDLRVFNQDEPGRSAILPMLRCDSAKWGRLNTRLLGGRVRRPSAFKSDKTREWCDQPSSGLIARRRGSSL